jgi:hypothetical protein
MVEITSGKRDSGWRDSTTGERVKCRRNGGTDFGNLLSSRRRVGWFREIDRDWI